MLAPTTMRRLTREVSKLQRTPPDGIALDVGEQDLLDLDGWIQGPAGTPYAGGFFRVHLTFVGTDFPAGPPKCTMRTKIFHPNIHANGEICVSTLKRDWSSSFGIEHILTVVKCLLISPNPDSALDPEAARLLQEAYEEYASTASIWTRVHASQRPNCMANTIAAQVPLMAVGPSHAAPFDSAATAPGKKMEMDGAACPSPMMTNELPSSYLSAQPLTRSGSTNVNVRQAKHSTAAAQQDRRLSSTTANNVSNVGAMPSAPPFKSNLDSRPASIAVLETGMGAAAAAAAQTAAFMTAAVTAEMNRITLNDNQIRSAPSIPCATSLPILDTSHTHPMTAGTLTTNSMTWPTRRRAPVVRRGIKRL